MKQNYFYLTIEMFFQLSLNRFVECKCHVSDLRSAVPFLSPAGRQIAGAEISTA